MHKSEKLDLLCAIILFLWELEYFTKCFIATNLYASFHGDFLYVNIQTYNEN